MADSFVDAVNNKATGGNAIVPEAMDLLKTFESFKPTSYYDLDNKKKRGTLTVGYGFTKTIFLNCEKVIQWTELRPSKCCLI